MFFHRTVMLTKSPAKASPGSMQSLLQSPSTPMNAKRLSVANSFNKALEPRATARGSA